MLSWGVTIWRHLVQCVCRGEGTVDNGPLLFSDHTSSPHNMHSSADLFIQTKRIPLGLSLFVLLPGYTLDRSKLGQYPAQAHFAMQGSCGEGV